MDIHGGRSLPRVGANTPGDPSLDVTRLDSVNVTNSAPTTIVVILGGDNGQRVSLRFQDPNTTIAASAAKLAGRLPFVGAAFAILTIEWEGQRWCEVSRSLN
jgi:hypothetical protein